jgi:hypothetical protein
MPIKGGQPATSAPLEPSGIDGQSVIGRVS